jgi:hypothetical protein
MQTETLPLALANPYKIGDGVTLCGYSDRSAYTVIAVTAKTITIQRDKATLLPEKKMHFNFFLVVLLATQPEHNAILTSEMKTAM